MMIMNIPKKYVMPILYTETIVAGLAILIGAYPHNTQRRNELEEEFEETIDYLTRFKQEESILPAQIDTLSTKISDLKSLSISRENNARLDDIMGRLSNSIQLHQLEAVVLDISNELSYIREEESSDLAVAQTSSLGLGVGILAFTGYKLLESTVRRIMKYKRPIPYTK